MKRILMVAALAAIVSGCAGQSWKEYSTANDCQYANQQALRKQVNSMNMSSPIPTANGSFTPGSVSIPTVEFRPVYKYNCKNGDIWAYDSPKS